MKFQLSFKTPHAVELQAISKHIDTHCENHEDHDLNCDLCLDLEDISCHNISDIMATTAKFVRHGEQVTIEFDTETQTAVVVKL